MIRLRTSTTEPRPARAVDLPAVGALLDRAFSAYQVSLSFEPAVMDLFWAWDWGPSKLSLFLGERNAPRAVVMSSVRMARWRGSSLVGVHVGPVGVDPDYQRRGYGRTMMEAVERRAIKRGADFMTLTVEARYGAQRLYGRLGYQIIERFRPLLAPLQGAGGRWVPGGPVEEVSPIEPGFVFRREPAPQRWNSAIVEAPRKIFTADTRLGLRGFQLDDAAAVTLTWPVREQFSWGTTRGRITQVLRVNGEGAPLYQVLRAASADAAQLGSAGIYGLPSVGLPVTMFRPEGTAFVYRMAKGLTDVGKAAVEGTIAYYEICPAC